MPELPGVLVCGATKAEAMRKVETLALRVIAERLEHSETQAIPFSIAIPAK